MAIRAATNTVHTLGDRGHYGSSDRSHVISQPQSARNQQVASQYTNAVLHRSLPTTTPPTWQPPQQALQMTNMPLTSTANKVSELSASIASYIEQQGILQPDLSVSTSVLPDTPEYRNLRNQLNDAIQDLHLLTNGPLHHFRTLSWSVVDLAAAQVALTFKFPHIVPNNDVGLTAVEIAEKAGLEQDRTTRILKMLATHRIFEDIEGRFRHTANSEFLRTSGFTAMAETSLDDCFKGAAEMNVMFEASPTSVLGKDNSPFHTRFGKTFYGYYGENQEKALRFSKAMIGWALGKLMSELKSSACVTDYNEPQSVRDAGIYLMRNVFHNNNDEDSARILCGLIPALEGRSQDARLLINDCIVPQRAGGDITRSEENTFRQLDLMMMMLFEQKRGPRTIGGDFSNQSMNGWRL
ncbi:hypothetical protein J1614_003471 [Plenodomus biglobosus]|nr:hypothetical protein J1614_003471 [Plenodomus biglobosus]